MFKKVLSLFLVVFVFAAFSAPALAFSQDSDYIMIDEDDEFSSETNSTSIQSGIVHRTFSTSQSIPSSILYSRIINNRIYAGNIPRTGVIINNFLNNVLVSQSTTYSGNLPHIGYTI
jgi:hypothetical protein